MAISKSTIETRLRPYLLTHLPASVQDLMNDTVLLAEFNQVAHDLNERGQLNLERFRKKANTTNSEDAYRTNYLLQGTVSKVVTVRYEGADWETMYWTYSSDRIAFGPNQPTEDVIIEVRYVRRCEEVSADSDTIDLPAQVDADYLQLLKEKFMVDYGEGSNRSYEDALDYYAQSARRKVDSLAFPNKGIARFWFHQSGDDTVYDITSNYLPGENWTTDVNSNLFHNEFTAS